MSREYTTCPFTETTDGIRTHMGTMCGLFHDAKGKPLHECVKINCEAWDVIDELDGDASSLGDECNRLDDTIATMNEKLREYQGSAGIV